MFSTKKIVKLHKNKATKKQKNIILIYNPILNNLSKHPKQVPVKVMQDNLLVS